MYTMNNEKIAAAYNTEFEHIVIIKASNGKYFVEYGYNANNGSYTASTCGFETLMEAENALISHRPTAEKVTEESTPTQTDAIEVTTYVINEGTSSQYYGLKTIEDNQVLTFAPNNWKTEKGALNWAKKHGCTVAAPMPEPAQEETAVEAEPKPAAAPVKHKKLTEKEWKKQLEAKAAFEAAEKTAALAEIESRFEIGAKLSDGSIITEIETEEGATYIITKLDPLAVSDYYNTECWDSEDFLNGVIAFEEIPEPEQPDENQITFDEITTYSANDTADNCAASTSPIDETAAKRGHESYSTSDYKPGSATAAYNAAVADVRAAADDVRERIPEEYRGELDKLVNRYAARLADWTNRKNRADASCPSWFITGAANYPHRKHDNHCVFRSHISVC